MIDPLYEPKAAASLVKVYLQQGKNGDMPHGSYFKHHNANVTHQDDGRIHIADAATGDIIAMYNYGSWSHVIVEQV